MFSTKLFGFAYQWFGITLFENGLSMKPFEFYVNMLTLEIDLNQYN